jgi:predicted CoA-binding protein
MKAHGYRIIPVNPAEKSVLGEQAYAGLDEVPGRVEMVVVFRKPEFVPEIVEAAIRIGAKAIWMQEGIVHEEAAQRAREAGLQVVQDRCILKEHARRFLIGV